MREAFGSRREISSPWLKYKVCPCLPKPSVCGFFPRSPFSFYESHQDSVNTIMLLIVAFIHGAQGHLGITVCASLWKSSAFSVVLLGSAR